MAKYRKKPIVVDAAQYLNGVPLEGMTYYIVIGGVNQYWIQTERGRATVSDKDWVIKVAHNLYKLRKPEHFEATYEKVEG